MFTKRQRDVTSSLVCIAIGTLFSVGSIKYGSLRSSIPNAGFFPLLGGVTLMILSVITFVGAVKKKEGVDREKFFAQPYSLKRIGLFLVALGVYSLALEYLGFLIITFLFLMFLLKFIEPQRWSIVLITSFLTATFSYFLFEVLLKVQLPHGLLGSVFR